MPALVISFGTQVGGIALYEALKPEPPPALYVHLEGQGEGVVQSVPEGIKCGEDCVGTFEKGSVVKLVATLGEGATFPGWSGDCAVGDDVLECYVTLEETTHITAQFGLVPEEVEVAMVAWGADRGDDDEPETIVDLPAPELEAEMLEIPIEELLQPQPPPEVAQAEPQPQPEPQSAEEPPEPIDKVDMTSVEVPDENEVEEAPDDARFLSDKNRDVADETRATETNLEKAQSGDTVASEESEVESEDIGAEEDEIAQLDDVDPTSLDAEREEESEKLGYAEEIARIVGGEEGQDGEDGDEGDGSREEEPGALAMRNIEGRGGVFERDEPGGDPGREGDPGDPGRADLQLAEDSYERVVGEEKAETERELARKARSKRRGRWEKKLGMVKSSLENFTPDVRPGNQTALKTRAAPFAVFIARMHRRIHELWGFGFLEDLDDKSATHPLNDWNLKTKLEIVINPDGTVHKATIVSTSGLTTFDVAAIDAILTAAPFEPPPEKIRSPNGKVYMHWGFYRNHRQCGTFNAQPYILSEAPEDDADTGLFNDADLAKQIEKRKNQGLDEADKVGAPVEAARAHANLPSPDDPEAVHAANIWITGFTKRDPNKMAKVSTAPFRSGTAIVANSRSEIASVYRTILREARGLDSWKLFSHAGFRKAFGALPAGVEPATDQLLLVVLTGDRQRLTLVLKRDGAGAYYATALHR